MRKLNQRIPAIVAAIMVAGCGGSGDVDVAAALRARALESQRAVLMLADPTPCASDNQCALLSIRSTVPSCDAPEPIAYSLVSSTATAAEDAARQQNTLADQAYAAAGSPLMTCTMQGRPVFRAACVAGACKPVSTPLPAAVSAP